MFKVIVNALIPQQVKFHLPPVIVSANTKPPIFPSLPNLFNPAPQSKTVLARILLTIIMPVFLEPLCIQLRVFQLNMLLQGSLRAVVPATPLLVAIELPLYFLGRPSHSPFPVRVHLPLLLSLLLLGFFLA